VPYNIRSGLALKCTTNVGEIRTTGFTGHIEAFTNVGTIICMGLHGSVDLRTEVGDIRAEYTPDASAAIHVDASANVGSIELAGPKDIFGQADGRGKCRLHRYRPAAHRHRPSEAVHQGIARQRRRLDQSAHKRRLGSHSLTITEPASGKMDIKPIFFTEISSSISVKNQLLRNWTRQSNQLVHTPYGEVISPFTSF
jgi:hypothetical protein